MVKSKPEIHPNRNQEQNDNDHHRHHHLTWLWQFTPQQLNKKRNQKYKYWKEEAKLSVNDVIEKCVTIKDSKRTQDGGSFQD